MKDTNYYPFEVLESVGHYRLEVLWVHDEPLYVIFQSQWVDGKVFPVWSGAKRKEADEEFTKLISDTDPEG